MESEFTIYSYFQKSKKLRNLLTRTKALVLRETKFRDQSKICLVFTEHFGTLSVMLKGVRNPKNQMNGLFSTGNMVEMVFYRKNNRDLHLVRDARLLYSPLSAAPDLERFSAIYQLVATLREVTGSEDPHHLLFNALELTMEQLCHPESPNYQLLLTWFLLRLTTLLGFEPGLDRCVLTGEHLDCGNTEGVWFLFDPGGIALPGPGSRSGTEKRWLSGAAWGLLCSLRGQTGTLQPTGPQSRDAASLLSEVLQDYCSSHAEHAPGKKNRQILSRLASGTE